MSGWGCPHEVDGTCDRVRGAYCKPGMRGCVLAGKVEFPDGRIPAPEWPRGSRPGPASGDESERPDRG